MAFLKVRKKFNSTQKTGQKTLQLITIWHPLSISSVVSLSNIPIAILIMTPRPCQMKAIIRIAAY